MAGEAADPEGYKRKFLSEQACIFDIYYRHGGVVCVDAAWGAPLCGGGISGSSASDRSRAFCKGCRGGSVDRSRIWNFMFLGDIKGDRTEIAHD